MNNLIPQSTISSINEEILKKYNDKLKKEPGNEGSRYKQYLAAISACIITAACGASQAWPSPAIPHLTSNRSTFSLKEEEVIWVVSLFTLGDFIGSFLNPVFIDRIGRKNTLLLFAMPGLIGWCLIIFAQNYIYLYIARFLVGINQGSYSSALVIYLTEISEKNIRGALVNMIQISLSLGLCYATIIATFLSYELLNILSALLFIVFYLLFPFLSETPYYYLLRERSNDAMKCLMKLRGITSPDKLEAEMREMILAVEEERKHAENSVFWELISKSYNRKGLIITFWMKVAQLLSGILPITFYAEDIFSNNSLPITAAVQVVIFNGVGLPASLCTNLIIDKVNRRILFLSSGIICSICLAGVGVFFFMKDKLQADTSSLAWLPVVSLSLYQIVFLCGIGIIPFICLGELFPLNVKSSAGSYGAVIGGLFAFGSSAGYKALSDTAGYYTSFWLFAAAAFIGSAFSFWIMPNTTRMTLEEIQAMQNPDLGVKLRLERNMNISKRVYEKYAKL